MIGEKALEAVDIVLGVAGVEATVDDKGVMEDILVEGNAVVVNIDVTEAVVFVIVIDKEGLGVILMLITGLPLDTPTRDENHVSHKVGLTIISKFLTGSVVGVGGNVDNDLNVVLFLGFVVVVLTDISGFRSFSIHLLGVTNT